MFFGGHFVEGVYEHAQAGIGQEECTMPVHESPKEPIPHLLPWASLVVAHFHDVVTTRYVGLGGHKATIGKLTHAIYIGDHYPIVGIYEHFHEPFIDIVRMKLAQQHKVAQYHEPLYMVAITGLQHLAYGIVDGWYASSAVIKAGGYGAGKPPKVGSALPAALLCVDQPNELAPANDLPNEAFQRVERYGVLCRMGQSSIYHLLRSEQTCIEHGGEYRMEECGVAGSYSVFVHAKMQKTLMQELLQCIGCR